jgi:hypothetical protein
MHQRTMSLSAVLLLSLGATVAQAQTTATAVASPTSSSGSAPAWTVDSGQTIGEGNSVVRGQVGWPGLWADYIHGIDPTFDIGGRFGLNWGGPVGATYGSQGIGLEFQLLLRKQFFEIAGYKVAFTFDPGFLLQFPSGISTQFGLAFPIGAQIGFPVSDKLVFNGTFALPMYVTFGDFGSFYIPILFGGGVEYQFQPNLAVTFSLALGPTIGTGKSTTVDGVNFSYGGGTVFTLQAMVGIAYKL